MKSSSVNYWYIHLNEHFGKKLFILAEIVDNKSSSINHWFNLTRIYASVRRITITDISLCAAIVQ